MCRTAHALLQTLICGIQMLVRVFMTVILMIENLIRMILQTLYNFISFMLQMISLIPICVVFLLTARLKCFMCGGGGPCPVNRGGTCDCLMSAVAIIILFIIFRATGVLDKIFYKLGYVKARPVAFTRFVPTPGDITECSRNDTEEETTAVATASLFVTDDYEAESKGGEGVEVNKFTDITQAESQVATETEGQITKGQTPEEQLTITTAQAETLEATTLTTTVTDTTVTTTAVTTTMVTTTTTPDISTIHITTTPDISTIHITTTIDTSGEDARRGLRTKMNTWSEYYSTHNWTTVMYYLV